MSDILIVDDEKKIRHLLSIILSSAGYTIFTAEDGAVALEMIKSNSYDLVISDMKMPNLDGVALLEKIKEEHIHLPVIFITAFANVDIAVNVMKSGACDFISKPFEEERILLAVRNALRIGSLVNENVKLKEKLESKSGFGEIIAESEEFNDVLNMASRVAQTNSTVLITGESGVGKEVIARFIHKTSDQKQNRFVAVNCAAISGGLVESEFFGHEKGSFTGANQQVKGKFEYASKGTIFLDEIGDLPLDAQSKLLRVLQEKSFQPVGSNVEVKVDLRVICATNQDLETLVKNKTFRKDLYYRINVFPIKIPPLRERKSDILSLVNHFMHKLSDKDVYDLSGEAEKKLLNYNWPGNVRELINAVERAIILAGNKNTIDRQMFDFICKDEENMDQHLLGESSNEALSLDAMEKNMVLKAFEVSQGNKTAAAKLLGITRARLRVLIKKYEK